MCILDFGAIDFQVKDIQNVSITDDTLEKTYTLSMKDLTATKNTV